VALGPERRDAVGLLLLRFTRRRRVGKIRVTLAAVLLALLGNYQSEPPRQTRNRDMTKGEPAAQM